MGKLFLGRVYRHIYWPVNMEQEIRHDYESGQYSGGTYGLA